MGSYQLPIDTYGPSLTVFELFSRLLKRFSSASPSVRPFFGKTDILVNKMLMLFALYTFHIRRFTLSHFK